MDSEPFLKPRLTGPRFDGHAIPLDVLADLAVLEQMVVEVAKWKYREANPARKRVPRGFADGLSLKLTGVEDGSAVPVISLFVAASSLLPPSSQAFFAEARSAIVGAIGAAEQGGRITDHLPPRLLGYFDRLGRSLQDGEAIEFADPAAAGPARLTQATRHTLVRASAADEYTDAVVLVGTVPEVDQQNKTFHLRLPDGSKVKAPLTAQHFDTVLEVFNNYAAGLRARMSASGRFNLANRLQGIESVEHMSVLDPLDVAARLDELRQLRHGWLDGKGVAPPAAGLDWLASAFDRHYPDDVPLPYLYPTAEGGVRAEWPLKPHEVSLEIDLAGRRGDWHALNLADDGEAEATLPLDDPGAWAWLVGELRRLAGAGA